MPLLMAVGMFWQTGWSLVLGFTLSSLLQAIVPEDQMRRALGTGGVKEIALPTVARAASSSCSYASAAIMRTLFKKVHSEWDRRPHLTPDCFPRIWAV
jgi:uncharacterized membrane protein YraQ (UPF0718 family)